MIPFPRIVDVNPLSEQMNFEAALRNSSKRASSSVGVLIAIAKKLSGDRDFMSSVVKNVQQIMGKNAHHRILRSYTMLMLFALKVRSLFISNLSTLIS